MNGKIKITMGAKIMGFSLWPLTVEEAIRIMMGQDRDGKLRRKLKHAQAKLKEDPNWEPEGGDKNGEDTIR